LCKPFLIDENIGLTEDEDWFVDLVEVFKDRLSYGAQIVDLYRDFFEKPFVLEGEALDFVKQEGVKALLETFKSKVEVLDSLSSEALKKALKESGKETDMKGKMLFMPLRIAVSASMHGPDLPKMMNLMGKERLNMRLEYTINHL